MAPVLHADNHRLQMPRLVKEPFGEKGTEIAQGVAQNEPLSFPHFSRKTRYVEVNLLEKITLRLVAFFPICCLIYIVIAPMHKKL